VRGVAVGATGRAAGAAEPVAFAVMTRQVAVNHTEADPVPGHFIFIRMTGDAGVDIEGLSLSGREGGNRSYVVQTMAVMTGSRIVVAIGDSPAVNRLPVILLAMTAEAQLDRFFLVLPPGGERVYRGMTLAAADSGSPMHTGRVRLRDVLVTTVAIDRRTMISSNGMTLPTDRKAMTAGAAIGTMHRSRKVQPETFFRMTIEAGFRCGCRDSRQQEDDEEPCPWKPWTMD